MKKKGTNSNSNLSATTIQAQGTTTISSNTANSPINVSGYTTTGGTTITSTTYPSSGYYSVNGLSVFDKAWEEYTPKVDISDEGVKKIVEKIFDSEEDLMPLVKNYLVKYLDKVMDEPEEIVKELVKEKDEKINQLEEQVEELNKKIAELEEKVEKESRAFDLGGTRLGPTTTEWIYDHSNTTSTGGAWTTTYDYDGDSSSMMYCSDLSALATDSANIISSLASTTDKNANQAYTVKASYDALTSKIEQKLSALNTTATGT